MKRKFTHLARSLRKNSTEAEKLLWHRVRNRQIENVKFRRQQPIGRYIVDFVSFEKRIVVELDGGQHATTINREKDKTRDAWLSKEGYEVLRFWDNEVFENLEGILEVIRARILSPSPLPL